jgi:hypothetical protein
VKWSWTLFFFLLFHVVVLDLLAFGAAVLVARIWSVLSETKPASWRLVGSTGVVLATGYLLVNAARNYGLGSNAFYHEVPFLLLAALLVLGAVGLTYLPKGWRL